MTRRWPPWRGRWRSIQFLRRNINKGNLFSVQDRFEDALACYDRALALQPSNPDALGGKAIALVPLGRIDDARVAIEKALAMAPREVRFYSTLAQFRKFTHDDPHLNAMRQLARDSAHLGVDDEIDLDFALAKALTDAGEAEASFRHLLKGNSLKRKTFAYDEATLLDFLERVRKAFTREFIREREGQGDPSAIPVFIVGMPRSGTTLVEQILASHPMVMAPANCWTSNKRFPTLAATSGATLRARIRRCASRTGTWPNRRGLCRAHSKARPAGSAHHQQDARQFPTRRPDPSRPAERAHPPYPARPDRDLHVLLFKAIRGDLPYAYDLAELGRYYRAYEALTAHWLDALPPGVMIDVQYEDVVDDLEGQARRIVAHCGLEWDPKCLDFHKSERKVLTASKVQVRQPINRDSLERWRPHEALIRPLREALAPRRTPLTPPPSASESANRPERRTPELSLRGSLV